MLCQSNLKLKLKLDSPDQANLRIFQKIGNDCMKNHPHPKSELNTAQPATRYLPGFER